MVMNERLYLGIDVGTGSARAGLFDDRGHLRGAGAQPLAMNRPREDFVEQSSADIVRACGEATRAALRQAGAQGSDVAGIGFDATCSLVALGEGDRPVSVSPDGDDAWNVIVWMDHRAVEEAQRINRTGHRVLKYVGGVISPEMEIPKILWLKERLPERFATMQKLYDLPDFLSHWATGSDVRSLCTTVCKWTYMGHEATDDQPGWDRSFFDQVGLSVLAEEGYARIGTRVRPMGERAGTLLPKAAEVLGLTAGIPVAVSIIDAHAGGLGLLGAPLDGVLPGEEALTRRLALIGGTSTCHMGVSQEALFVPGVWGPYYAAMIPGMWLTEGGQSATGALIDHVIATGARAAELREEASQKGVTVYALLNQRLDAMAAREGVKIPAALTRDLHVLPDHHGNRSPRADPSLRGMVSGLKLTDSVDSLALLYLATIQALALGTRHILDTMNRHGHRVEVLFASGGDTKNPIFLREHADATGSRVALPEEPEAVLLGAAVLGAVASGRYPSVVEAMGAMNRAGSVIAPNPEAKRYFDAKYEVFLAMHDHQMAYRRSMEPWT